MIKINKFKIGDRVVWNWMGHKVQGSVKKVYVKPVSRTFHGTEYRRNASNENPAYLIKSDAGNDILKAHSELKRVKSLS